MLVLILFLSPGCLLLKMKFDKYVDPPTGTLTFQGPSADIVIRRDSLGVPFIEAQNENDLALASGYVAAEDRLWQMVMMSMRMQGRLSEIAGMDMAVMGAFLHSVTREAFLDELGGDKSPCWQAFLDANTTSYPAAEDHLLHRPESPFWANITT